MKIGRPTKKQERRDLIFGAYNKNYHTFGGQVIKHSIVEMEERYQNSWKQNHETPNVRWRLNQVEKLLGRKINKPVMIDEKSKVDLIKQLEDMELEFPIEAVPGARKFLSDFKKNYPQIKLGIISDAIYSPGRSIRKILKSLSLLKYFDYFAFSDEVGKSKPSPVIFKYLAESAGVGPSDFVHIGDRLSNDIVGADEFGARGIFCGVVHQRNMKDASLSFTNYMELQKLLQKNNLLN